MPKRIPLGSIGVTRDGKTIYPTIGEVFDFTADEVAEINGLAKASGNPLIRKPVNEDPTQGAGKPAGDDLQAMTVVKLKELAESRGVDLGDLTKKDEIVAKLNAAEEEDL